MVDLDEVVPWLDRKACKNFGWIGPPGIDTSNRCNNASASGAADDNAPATATASGAVADNDDDKFEEKGEEDVEEEVGDVDNNSGSNVVEHVSCG